jgi:hypothetical protein
MFQIRILNETNDRLPVSIAIYKKPLLPQTGSIAWKVVVPGPCHPELVQVPEEFQVYAEYSQDPRNPDPPSPDATRSTTDTVSFKEATAHFQIVPVNSQDDRATGAYITQVSTDLVPSEFCLKNDTPFSLLGHIQLEHADLYPPHLLRPRMVWNENLLSPFYLAVVGQRVSQGSQVQEEVGRLTETPVLEGGTFFVTGCMTSGYSITMA